jgi:hypothetical protein
MPISLPAQRAPKRATTNASVPESAITPRSRGRARKSTVSASGVSASATSSLPAGSGTAGASSVRTPSSGASRTPSAMPSPIATNVSPAPARRAVPETRFFVPSSVSATVSASPGTSAMSPASAGTSSTMGPIVRAATSTKTAATGAAIHSNMRPKPARRSAICASAPTSSPTSAPVTTSRAPPPKNTATAADASPEDRTEIAGPQRSRARSIASSRASAPARSSAPTCRSCNSASSALRRSRFTPPGSTRRSAVRCASGGPKPAKMDVGVVKNCPSTPSRVESTSIASSRRCDGAPATWSARAKRRTNASPAALIGTLRSSEPCAH